MSLIRSAVRRLHLWLGMSLGLLLALLGLTGALLVFYTEIDAALHSAVRIESSEAAPGWDSPVWDVVMATAKSQYPDPQGDWSLEVTGERGAIPARFYPRGGRGTHHVARQMVWFSSDGRQVIRSDTWGHYVMSWIYELHMHLLAGETGSLIVGWGGLATLLVLSTGLLTWWPRGRLRNALSFKRNAVSLRRLRDLHKHFGVWSLLVLLLLVFTGGLLALPGVKTELLASLVAEPDAMPAPTVTSSPAARAPLTQVLAAAHAALPQARLAFIDVAGDSAAPIRLRVQVPGDPHRRFPGSFIFVDPHVARVLAVHDAGRGNAATRIATWIRPIHDGSIGGLVTRVLALVLGLVPLVLLSTGFLHWQRRRARRHACNPSTSVSRRN